MKPVPFTRPTISKKDLISVLEHLIDEDLSTGETVSKFEKDLGRTLGMGDRVTLTNSGASSLFLILQHMGIEPGDEIVVSPLSEVWVGEVIHYFSAVPVWVDLSLETLQMNPEHLKQKINANTRAVILNHHFGYPLFIQSSLSKKESPLTWMKEFPHVQTIEDVTSGLFTRYHHQYLGSFGDYAFTCFENKRIITTQRGGAVFAKNLKQAKEIRAMRSYREKTEKPSHPNPEDQTDKGNSFQKRLDLSLSDMQAALGLSELTLVDKIISRCQEIKQFYQDSLAKGQHSFITVDEDIAPNHFAFPVILEGNTQTAQKIFSKEKIKIKDLVQGTCYEVLPYLEDLKNLHHLKHKVILIPIYPTLKKEEIEKISSLLNSIR